MVTLTVTFGDNDKLIYLNIGLYFISSFMHFEPWHMFTSFIQYMFLLPSCTCILLLNVLIISLTSFNRCQHFKFVKLIDLLSMLLTFYFYSDVRDVQFA